MHRSFAIMGGKTLTIAVVAVLYTFVALRGTTVSAIAVEWSEPLVHMSPRRRTLQDDLFSSENSLPKSVNTTTCACRTGVHLEWSTRVGSSVLATPRIVDLNYDGNKEVLVPTYSQYLEAIDGASGVDVSGFPFVHPGIKTYSSPIPVDVLDDGTTEWLFAMYTGELLLVSGEGEMRGGVRVPSFPMKKEWILRSVDNSSAANVTMAGAAWLQESIRMKRMNHLGSRGHQPSDNREPNGVKLKRPKTSDAREEKGSPVVGREGVSPGKGGPERVLQQGRDHTSVEQGKNEKKDDKIFDLVDPEDGLVEDPSDDPNNLGKDPSKDPRSIGTDGWLSSEARASMDLLYHPELYKSSVNYEEENDPFSSHNLLNPSAASATDGEVVVDPHIMSTPVVTNIDGKGNTDVVVHVSFFFDPRDYDKLRDGLPTDDAQATNYVVDALMVINLVEGEVKWLKVLHITTKNDTAPAFAFSSPAVANVNEKQQRDIFVTTTAGAIFGFHGDGKELEGWPVWMNSSITASVSVEDVDGDGVSDVCTGDALGYVACFSREGRKIWSNRFSGAVGDHITFGDVDGDGNMDMAFGTSSGLIYAVKGSDGSILPHFPIATEGPIVASPLLVKLDDSLDTKYNEEVRGLHIVVPSHDGVLYIIKGTSGCVDAIDINEKSSTMVLADDVTGNGMLDLVVSTLSGSIMVFETATKFHPLKAWPSRVKSVNGFTASEGHVGVFIHPSSRVSRDIRGHRFTLIVTVHDERKGKNIMRLYGVAVTIGPRVHLGRYIFNAPGTYVVDMHAPLERMYGVISVSMTLPNGQTYEDTLALSFNMHFLESVKYVFLIPFVAVCVAHSFVMKKHQIASDYTAADTL